MAGICNLEAFAQTAQMTKEQVPAPAEENKAIKAGNIGKQTCGV